MANRMIEGMRPGASVECLDGRLGSFESVERDDSGNPLYISVRRGWTNQELLVPVDLVCKVRADGSIQLACDKEDLEDAGSADHAAPMDLTEPVFRPTFDEPIAPRREGEWRRRAADQPAETEEWEETVELKQEELVAHKELREAGEVQIRKEIEEVPGRLEVDALREEIEVEHVPVGQVVTERVEPWQEGDVLVLPIYEEQLVVTKRLVLREHIRVRRVGTIETRLFEDTLRRERLVVDDPADTGLVHEQYAEDDGTDVAEGRRKKGSGGGLFGFGRD